MYKFKIVIADDEPVIRKNLSDLLVRKFDDIECVALCDNGEQVIEVLKGGNVDIVITDIQMPRTTGLDVAEYMHFSKPSVSRAVSLLKNGGFIVVDKNGFIELTDAGREVADSMYERHRLLTSLLTMLGVDEETAAEDACKIEHDISEKSFEAIKKHVKLYMKK